MTRVALDVTPLVGQRTGIGASVAAISTALRALPDGPELAPYAVGAPRHRTALPAGARFVPIPARVASGLWARSEHPRMDRLLDANVLHATNFLVPPSRLPTLTTVHDCGFVLHPDTVAAHTRSFAPMLRRALRRGAHVHVATEQVGDEVEQLFAPGLRDQGRLHVIPFGVPDLGPAGGDTGLPGGPPYVLFLARIEPRKDAPVLVRAMAAIPNIRLVIAGPAGPDSGAVTAAISALPPEARERVLVVGAVDGARKRALLEGALALVYPSRYEGFGFPVLEAMAAGTAVLAADIPVLAEVAGGAAHLVPPGSDDAWAAAITQLAADDTLRARLVVAGRARAATFGWERTAHGLADCYRRLSDSA